MLKKIQGLNPLKGLFTPEGSRVEPLYVKVAKMKDKITNRGYASFDDYMNDRRELNLDIISLIFGAEIKKSGKDGFRLVCDKSKVITAREAADLYLTLEELEKSESIMMNIINEIQSGNNDMEIPKSIYPEVSIPELEKVSESSVSDIVFGNEGKASILNTMIKSKDISKLIKFGEVINMKKDLRNKVIIGAAVVAVGVGAYVGYKKYQEYKAAKEAPAEIEDVFMEEDDLDDIDADVE